MLTVVLPWVVMASQVRWRPPVRTASGALVQPLCVITASMDRSMLVWQPEDTGGVWSPVVRVGEVGGNTLGFYGGLCNQSGTAVLAHGYHGSLHLWRRASAEAAAASASAAATGAGTGGEGESEDVQDMSGHWEPALAAAGHYAPVMDATWGTNSEYLVTASSDQTCRIFAPWCPGDATTDGSGSGDGVSVWRELGRPQVHGYDMTCCAVPPLPGSPHRWMSGADEKVRRGVC